MAFVLAVMLSANDRARAGNDSGAAMPRYFTINEVVATLGNHTSSPAINQAPVQLAAIAAPPVAIDGREPFGLVTFRAPEGLLWAKWRKVEMELAEEAQELARCRTDRAACASPAAPKYLAIVAQARALSGRAKIAFINRTINAAVRYTSDPDQYGVDDRWSPPLVTLQTGLGDCEDYAIAKYAVLRDAGYSADDLRLVVVRDRLARQDHAVTAVREGGRWLMLDNRHEVLLEGKDARHFTPMFVLDQQGVKLFAVPYGAPPATMPARVASGVEDGATPPDAPDAATLGLRLDTFEPPQLRGGL